jgi:hypothetical protein
MYILKSFTPQEISSIKEGNKVLLKKKLEAELKKWNELLHLSKEDIRFTQGICCTLIDVIELL